MTTIKASGRDLELKGDQDIVFYPTDNIWISQGTKLIFEGTVPDDHEAKLQATAVTADRDIILPDASGTITLNEKLSDGTFDMNVNSLTVTGSGATSVIQASQDIELDAAGAVIVKDTPLRLASLTTTQRNALTPVNGDMIYNTTTNKIEMYTNGAWGSSASIEELVDNAPGTLDTLNELAAALGDDPNFATTVTNSLAGKLENVVEDTTPELGGSLVTAGNRITHAASGNVSHLNFTTTQFGVINQTVLSSVKDINFFLDSNGGDSSCGFRIYNNVDPDNLGATAESDYIFKVSENGDVNITGDIVTNSAGTPTITSSTDIALTAGTGATNKVEVTQSPFKLANLTDAQRDALTAENGYMIYNTDDNRFQAYQNGAWVRLDFSAIV